MIKLHGIGMGERIIDPRYVQTLEKMRSKNKHESMKMEERDVHCNRYDGHCMKQWVRIPKAI